MLNNANHLPPLPPFQARILPVVQLENTAHAVPLAKALLAGGIDVIEITLRHSCALEAIAAVARQVPEMCVGAGTILQAEEMLAVQKVGARFALSPGSTPDLLQAALRVQMPFVPGVMTPSDVMAARAQGFRLLKLFPAVQAGGLSMLKALGGPLGDVRFCPTGGVSTDNLADFLRLPNVAMVGGSWLVAPDLIRAGAWERITELAKEAQVIAQTA